MSRKDFLSYFQCEFIRLKSQNAGNKLFFLITVFTNTSVSNVIFKEGGEKNGTALDTVQIYIYRNKFKIQDFVQFPADLSNFTGIIW